MVARPMVFTGDHAVAVQFIGRPEAGSGRFEVREEADVADRPSPGLPFVEGAWQNATDEDRLTGRPCGGPVTNHDAFYAAASRAGFSYGPHFRRITQLQADGDAWNADLMSPAADRDAATDRETTWDALLQSGAVMAAAGEDACWIPFGIDCVRLPGEHDEGPIVRLSGEWITDSNGATQRVANICGFGTAGTSTRLEFRGVRYRLLDALPAERPSPQGTTVAPVLTAVRPDTILAMVRTAVPDHRQPLLVRFIEDQLLEILQWDSSQRAQLAAGFAAVGVDSLTSLDLQYRLQTALEFALPLGEGFDQGSADELADALLRKHLNLDRN